MGVNTEFQKIIQILSGSDFEGCLQPPATLNEILELKNITGISINGGLLDLWLLANGAEHRRYGTPAFGVYTDGPTPCSFLSTQESIQTWQNLFESSKNYEQDRIRDAQKWKEAFGQDLLALEIDYGPEETRDARIKPVWSNPKWLPFATFNGYSTIVYYDADPNHGGIIGQIIAYQHDPDAIYLVANSFDEFFEKSNQLLVTESNLINWIKGK